MEFKLQWYDKLQYGAILLLTAMIPFTWRYAVWAALLLVLTSIIKMIAERTASNPALLPYQSWLFYAPIVYWMVAYVSLFWTDDMDGGLAIMLRKAVLIVIPACFLMTDTHYLSRRHLRFVGYVFVAALCAAFLWMLAHAAFNADGGFFNYVRTFYESRTHYGAYHHAYIALYATVAMVFVYYMLASRWTGMAVWHRLLLLAALIALFLYVVVVNSRAGLLSSVLVFVCCTLHQMFAYHRWWQAPLVALLLAAAGVGTVKLLPGQDRISSTLQSIQEKGRDGDVRIDINRSNWRLWLKKPVLGYGVGDYRALQQEQYTADGFEAGENSNFNAHNQYMESLLAGGIPCLLALLAFLLLPVAFAVWQADSRSLPIAVVTLLVLFNLLFESMLERQMGLLFAGLLYAYMSLILSPE